MYEHGINMHGPEALAIYRALSGFYHYKTPHPVYEHDFVMSWVLGRRITPDEEVRHRNGIRYDNHPTNLELWSIRGRCPSGAPLPNTQQVIDAYFGGQGPQRDASAPRPAPLAKLKLPERRSQSPYAGATGLATGFLRLVTRE